jgi:hypothetical protein
VLIDLKVDMMMMSIEKERKKKYESPKSKTNKN